MVRVHHRGWGAGGASRGAHDLGAVVRGSTLRVSASAYSDEHRPLAAYGLLTAAFGALFAGGGLALRARMPERPRAGDLALAGVATYKISRLLAKDRVTSVLRAPFTRYEGDAGPSEVEESPRGRGLRLALGELLVCPYCVGQWVVASIALGQLAAPRTTRFVTGTFAAYALADALQMAHVEAQPS
jgi:hypothetical protein